MAAAWGVTATVVSIRGLMSVHTELACTARHRAVSSKPLAACNACSRAATPPGQKAAQPGNSSKQTHDARGNLNDQLLPDAAHTRQISRECHTTTICMQQQCTCSAAAMPVIACRGRPPATPKPPLCISLENQHQRLPLQGHQLTTSFHTTYELKRPLGVLM